MRRFPRALPGLLLVLALALLPGALPLRAAELIDEHFTAEELARGRRIFTIHCARCHGMQGLGGTGPSLARPTLSQAKNFEALLNIIALGIPGTQMPAWRILMKKDQRVVAGFVRSLGATTVDALPGDPARGKALFAQAACNQCHSVAGHGGVKGPDLTLVGERRGAERLRAQLVEPGREKIQNEDGYAEYLPVRILTTSGREVQGLRLNEDGFTLQLRDLDNRIHSFRKDEVREMKKDFAGSIMPSFASMFNASQLDDLVAYLASLKGKS